MAELPHTGADVEDIDGRDRVEARVDAKSDDLKPFHERKCLTQFFLDL